MITNTHDSDGVYEIYTNYIGERADIYLGTLAACAFKARDWHSGQSTALYKLACGDYSYETLQGALGELERLAPINRDPDEPCVDITDTLRLIVRCIKRLE